MLWGEFTLCVDNVPRSRENSLRGDTCSRDAQYLSFDRRGYSHSCSLRRFSGLAPLVIGIGAVSLNLSISSSAWFSGVFNFFAAPETVITKNSIFFKTTESPFSLRFNVGDSWCRIKYVQFGYKSNPDSLEDYLCMCNLNIGQISNTMQYETLTTE